MKELMNKYVSVILRSWIASRVIDLMLLNLVFDSASIFIFLFFSYLWISSQRAPDVLGTSTKGPLKILISRTYRGPPWDFERNNGKIDNLMIKLYFQSNNPFITYFFTNIPMSKMGTSTGHLWDLVATCPSVRTF